MEKLEKELEEKKKEIEEERKKMEELGTIKYGIFRELSISVSYD